MTPASLKETKAAPPYNTPTASAPGTARHQPANMTRPARHARGLSFFARWQTPPHFDKSNLVFLHTKTYPVQHLRPAVPPVGPAR